MHKDGIRRAVTSKAGNATERHFEKHELRKLFQLGDVGECEVLNKFGQTSSQYATFLESQSTVVGVSSHDDIYKKALSKASDYDDIGTPFGGASASAKKASPFLGRSQRVLAKSKRKIDFTVKENRPDNVDAKGSVCSELKDAAIPVGSSPTNAIDVDTTVQDPSSSDTTSEAEIQALLETADRMREQGNDLAAVSILMDILKHKAPEGKQKLRVHKRLAEVGDSLSWLP